MPCRARSPTPSSGSASVSPSKRSGIGKHVADGAPGQLRVVERQLDIRPQHAFALPDDDLSRRGLLGQPGARDQLLGLPLDERGLRLRLLGRQSLAFSGLKLRQAATARRSTAADTPPMCPAPRRQSRSGGGLPCPAAAAAPAPARPRTPGVRRLTDHAVDNRTVEQLRRLRLTIIQPKPGQPAAVVQRPQESLDVGAVLDHDDRRGRRPSPAIAAPVSAARQAGTGRAPRQPAPRRPVTGSTVSSAGQKPP